MDYSTDQLRRHLACRPERTRGLLNPRRAGGPSDQRPNRVLLTLGRGMTAAGGWRVTYAGGIAPAPVKRPRLEKANG